jgi:hypothetical protein
VSGSWWRRLFGGGDSPRAGSADEIALSIVQDGQRRDVTVRELAVGTKLAGDALLQVLVDKGLVTHEEVSRQLRRITEERYRAGEPDHD